MTKAPNELEVAMTIAQHYKMQPSSSKDLQKAVSLAASSSPPCKSYIRSIGEFVARFCGGEDFKLLKYLDFVGIWAANDVNDKCWRSLIICRLYRHEYVIAQSCIGS